MFYTFGSKFAKIRQRASLSSTEEHFLSTKFIIRLNFSILATIFSSNEHEYIYEESRASEGLWPLNAGLELVACFSFEMGGCVWACWSLSVSSLSCCSRRRVLRIYFYLSKSVCIFFYLRSYFVFIKASISLVFDFEDISSSLESNMMVVPPTLGSGLSAFWLTFTCS